MPMLAIPLVIVICTLAVGASHWPLKSLLTDLDPAAKIGLCGLFGLGVAGTLVFFIGLGSLSFAVAAVTGLFAVGGLVGWSKWVKEAPLSFKKPGGAHLLFPLAISLALIMALVGVLAPSTMSDWDSIAYHLAVPKLWLQNGKIEAISFIHQSNFPFTVDSLFILGLRWGGQAGAKMFVWMYTLLGAITLFGLARQRYGDRAGWWASLAFTTVPIVLWQSGTAYIDVAHGLYAGLGLIFACWWLESEDTKYAWLSALMLGFALGTKYTGLQTLAVAGLVALAGAALLKRGVKPILLAGLVALAVGSPWYVKNIVWKENPVFPFFYSKLGGKDWDQRRAEIYTNEQNTFGVGREAPPAGGLQPLRLGHSILGLAYQPGRYVNPLQTQGQGDPMGAIGIAVIGALLLGMLAGQQKIFERALFAGILLSLLIWFVLTQQSRYIVTLAVPLALIAGQLSTRKGYSVLMGGLAGLQTLMSLYLLHSLRFSDQIQVVTGKVTPDVYQAARIGFFTPAQALNQLKGAKIALYDEVFGYLLDVPYYWANPGHSTQIPYDSMRNGAEYAAKMKELGFTHIYMNLSPQVKDPQLASLIMSALAGGSFPQEEKDRLMQSWEQKFTPLIIDAAQSGRLRVEQAFPRSVLLRIE